VRSKVVAEGLVAFQNWRVGLFESTHDFLFISDFAIEAFHLVIVVLVSAC
jgi:hypothetical protein